MVKSIKNINKLKYRIKELEIHTDQRGWLVEMLKRNELKEDIKQIYVATIKPGGVRGNHYHLKRTEWFFIATGEAEIFLKDIKTKEKIHFTFSSKKPKVITIFPRIVHAVKNSGKGIVYLVSAQNTVHNSKYPDTFPRSIIK